MEKKDLLKKRNVVGFGKGFKVKNGVRTDTPSVTVLVEKKEDISSLSADELIPDTIDGVKTDVIEVGKVIALVEDPKKKFRPAPGGVSIGHYNITTGTLGAVVKDNKTGHKLILSNNHVLANVNQGKVGDAILQPGAADGGKNPDDLIANLYNFIPIAFPGETPPEPPIPTPPPPPPPKKSWCPIVNAIKSALNISAKAVGSSWRFEAVKTTVEQSVDTVRNEGENIVDCAVAYPYSEGDVSENILEIGTITGINSNLTIGLNVKKFGRTTSLTQGQIQVLDITVNVGYGTKVATFTNQIMAGYMSAGGDSGSLLVDSENKAVGLLFAGSSVATFFNPISNVLAALDISF